MPHDFSTKIAWLDAQWTPPDGVIGQLRYGGLDWAAAQSLVETILSWETEIPPDEPLPQRFVALLWTIPGFIENNRSNLENAGVDSVRLSRFSGRVHHAVSTILGYP